MVPGMDAIAFDTTAAELPPPRLPCGPATAAFLLDFDGTLAAIVDGPAQARPHPHATATLVRLAALTDGAVAVVTGRPIAAIDDLLGLPTLCVAGVHGLERRDSDGRLWRQRANSRALAAARAGLQRLVGAEPRLLLEDKGLTLALHFRRAPDLAALAAEVTERIVARAGGELCRLTGSMVFEIAPAATSKGAAVEAVLADRPFVGRCPIYLGDDLGDEPAFERVNARGGLSVRIGAPAPGSVAHARLPSVDAAIAWLSGIGGDAGAP